MKALIQRISCGQIEVEGNVVAKTAAGLAVFLGISPSDTKKDIDYIIKKILNLRIFADTEGKMNLSLKDTDGEILLISQFTLYADCKKGMRPSFTDAAKPDLAKKTYTLFLDTLKSLHKKTDSGIFAADMNVKINVDGPVTIMLETPQK